MLTTFSRAGFLTPAIHLKCLLYCPQSLGFRTRMKMFSVSHKTAFVVDHCPYMAESSRQVIECDMLTKSRTQGVIPLAPVSKSLWTCAIECSMEYCRILFDIYPTHKLVSVWKLKLLMGGLTCIDTDFTNCFDSPLVYNVCKLL